MSRQLIRSMIANIYSSAAIVCLIVAVIMGSLVAGLICLIPLAFTLLAVFAVMALSGVTLNIASATIASITMGTDGPLGGARHLVQRRRRRRGVPRPVRLEVHGLPQLRGTARPRDGGKRHRCADDYPLCPRDAAAAVRDDFPMEPTASFLGDQE
jgi:hypothetical protein